MRTAHTHSVIRDSPRTSSVRRSDGTVSGSTSTLTRPPVIKSGDVLVSRPTARADVYDISVVPVGAHNGKGCYEDGLETGRQLARGLAVDGWFTCDHTHYVRIAKHRT